MSEVIGVMGMLHYIQTLNTLVNIELINKNIIICVVNRYFMFDPNIQFALKKSYI